MARRGPKLVVAAALLLALIGLVLLTFPWWFPWVLGPAASRFGVTFAAYERLGTKQFEIHDVQVAQGNVTFRARTIRAFLPPAWIWRRYFGAGNEAVLRVEDWTLEPAERIPETGPQPTPPTHPEDAEPTPISVSQIIRQARAQLSTLGPWLPKAELTDGVVALSGIRWLIPQVTWDRGALSAAAANPDLDKTGTVQARLPAEGPWQVTAQVNELQLGLNLALSSEPEVHVEGTIVWHTNEVLLAARFPAEGFLPESARVEAQSFRVPAASLKLEGYQDLTGSFELVWEQNRYRLNVNAAADPLPGEPVLFPVTAVVKAEGGLDAGRLDELAVRSPWVTVDLSAPVAFNYEGQILSGEAAVDITADLALQSWVPAAGRVHGRATVEPSNERFPPVSFSVAGEALEYASVRSDAVQVNGALAWPWLEITRADARIEEMTAALSGRADLESQVLATGEIHVEGKGGGGLLPSDVAFERVLLRASAQGPFDTLSHSGTLELDGFTAPQVSTVALRALWQGRGQELGHFEATAKADASLLEIRGSATGQGRAGLRLEQLTLSTNGLAVYELAQPFSVTLEQTDGAGATAGTGWLLGVEPFRWTGPGHELSLQAEAAWPSSGQFRVAAQAFNTAAFRDFLEPAPPAVSIDRLEAAGHWTNGPLAFELSAGSQFRTAQGLDLSGVLTAKGNSNGVSVTQFKISCQSAALLSGSGYLPVTVTPADPNRKVHVDETARIQVQAATVPNRAFWDAVASWTRLGVVDPQVEMNVSGSLAQPQGKISARVAAVRTDALLTNQEPIRVENLAAEVEISRPSIEVRHLGFVVEGQPVSLQAQVPLGPELSTDWKELVQWERATGNLRVPRANLAPFARLWPEIIAPQGHVEINATVTPGLQLGGSVLLEGAATRPLATLGPLSDLRSEIDLSGRQVRVRTFSGIIGGEPFRIEGTLDFGQRNPESGLPVIDLTLDALNIPLARRPDLIVRADLDLAITGGTNAPPVVSGEVRLRDSVFLSDLASLIPGGVEQPQQRPPYFSIELEPLASFGLDLRVSGTEFLKVRTPFFRGDISANFRIEGTLQNPAALGEVTIASGVVQFPFANLRVTQGAVTLTSQDPYRPELFVTASARTLGYEVKMEVRGKADAPVLEFSSVPPLNSEQVLLMLTSGEVPRQTGAFSQKQRAGRLALFLGRNLLSEFTGGAGTADRLTVESGQDVSESGRQTYAMEYRLSDDWSIVGEYDRFGEFNVALKWRLYSR